MPEGEAEERIDKQRVFQPRATARQAMSRSVMMPTTSPELTIGTAGAVMVEHEHGHQDEARSSARRWLGRVSWLLELSYGEECILTQAPRRGAQMRVM